MFDLFALNCPLLVEGIIIVQKYRVCPGIKSHIILVSMIIRKKIEKPRKSNLRQALK